MRKNLRRHLLHPQKPLAALNRIGRGTRRGQGSGDRGQGSGKSLFHIRPATLKDYVGLSDVFQEADLMHSTALPGLFRLSGDTIPNRSDSGHGPSGSYPARSRDYVAEIIDGANSVVLVAEQDGKLIGAVHAEVREAPVIPLVTPRRFAVIDALVVTRPHRRKGVGAALAEELQRWVKAKGISQIELTIYEFNKPALAFYQKLGFRTASRRLRKRVEIRE